MLLQSGKFQLPYSMNTCLPCYANELSITLPPVAIPGISIRDPHHALFLSSFGPHGITETRGLYIN